MVESTAASALSPHGSKHIKALILDAGPLLNNTTPPTAFIAQAEKIYTTPAVISEIRDPAARARLETQWSVFLNIRQPRAESVVFVKEFVRKAGTGDGAVLSAADWGILGLSFEIECELRGGREWVREKVPRRETVAGEGKKKKEGGKEMEGKEMEDRGGESKETEVKEMEGKKEDGEEPENSKPDQVEGKGEHEGEDEGGVSIEEHTDSLPDLQQQQLLLDSTTEEATTEDLSKQLSTAHISPPTDTETAIAPSDPQDTLSDSEASDPDGGGDWITPSNLHRQQKKAAFTAPSSTPSEPTTPLFAACSTTDFAMQNTLLLLPIPLISPTSPTTRIRTLKTWLFRCHACFHCTRNMTLQFCPSCGGPTLLRTSCSTDTATGKTRIYLKRNFQWNNRGNVFSIPKPTGGRASGKDGAGVRHEIVLRADQKEYLRQQADLERRKRKGERDLMDGDYLPSILTGERHGGLGEKVKIGHGRRNPNEKRGGGKSKKSFK